MARLARVVVPGYPHHVTQRGNRRLPTFFSPEDYRAYVEFLAKHAAAEGLAIWAWCLMPNHVHLIAVPETEEALAGAIGEAHRQYTRRINFREGWRGHLWQERFFSCVLDGPHALAAARYVERNPVLSRPCESGVGLAVVQRRGPRGGWGGRAHQGWRAASGRGERFDSSSRPIPMMPRWRCCVVTAGQAVRSGLWNSC